MALKTFQCQKSSTFHFFSMTRFSMISFSILRFSNWALTDFLTWVSSIAMTHGLVSPIEISLSVRSWVRDSIWISRLYLEPDLISLTKPSTCSVRAQSEQGIPVITKFIIYQSSSIHLRICWSRTLRSGEGVRNISYPPALAAGSETSRKGPECVKRRPQFPTFLRSSSRAPRPRCTVYPP